MPDEAEIYQVDAGRYQRLIEREDWQGNLLPAIQAVLPSPALHVLDLGAGTGRFERLLANSKASFTALDLSPAMLKVTQRDLLPQANLFLVQADHRWLPLAKARFDAALSGWSLCYLAVWHPETWRAELDQALADLRRVLRPGGKIILLETLGTGSANPHPPPHLELYFRYLEAAGFTYTWLRTDYRFQSHEEAHELVPFFFGNEMLSRMEGLYLPECTGLWQLTL